MSHPHAFSSLLADELSFCQLLFKLLQDEQTAISEQNLKQLNELQAQKQSTMNDLRLSAAARQQFMPDNDFLELNDLLVTLDQAQAQAIKSLWISLKSQYAANRDLSDSLAQTVQQAQWRAQQQLQILCGRSDKSDVYGEDGRPKSQQIGLGMVQA